MSGELLAAQHLVEACRAFDETHRAVMIDHHAQLDRFGETVSEVGRLLAPESGHDRCREGRPQSGL